MKHKNRQIIDENLSKFFKLIAGGASVGDIKEEIRDLLGVTESKVWKWSKYILTEYQNQNIDEAESGDGADEDEGMIMSEEDRALLLQSLRANHHRDVYYNDQDQVFVVNLNSKGNVIFRESELAQMLEAYSNFDDHPATVNEVCRRFEISRADFIDLKRKLGWTHDSLPIMNNDLLSKNENELVKDLKQKSLHGVEQRFRKVKWQETQKQAKKWQDFQKKKLNPYKEFMDNVDLSRLDPFPRVVRKTNFGDMSLVIGANDWQIGSAADSSLLSKGRDFNLDIAMACVDSFVDQLRDDILDTKRGFKEAHIFFAGDIGHGLKGTTSKGTFLGGKEMDAYEHVQFDAITKCMCRLIGSIAQEIPNLHVHSVRGNHLGFDWYPIIKLVEAMFSQNKHIKFNIEMARSIYFRVQDVLFIGDHGASADYKADIPKGNAPREAWVQSLLLDIVDQDLDIMKGLKQRIFIQGDKHSFEAIEKNNFEFYMFGALPLGDHYAAEHNLFSRSRQNAMVVDARGVKEIKNYYF